MLEVFDVVLHQQRNTLSCYSVRNLTDLALSKTNLLCVASQCALRRLSV